MAACRDATSADRPAVVELLAEQLAGHALGPPTAALDAAVGELLGDPRLGRILVAESGGRVVGVAALSWAFSLEHGGRSAWLDELFVAPSHRGRGIGAALLEAACAAARAAGAVAMDLEVEVGHERVSGLYEHHGFTRHRRQRWFLPLSRG